MATQIGNFILNSPGGLYALLFLVPFVLIYLIKPRPTLMEIPSLMFLLQSEKSSSQKSFLRKFVRDWLFWIQLFALLLLIAHLLDPVTKYEEDITAENTVIVLDVSGSSQVKEGTKTRYDIGLRLAKDALGAKNTIILAKGVPKIIAQNVPPADAWDALRSSPPLATPSSIGESIVLAGEVLGGNKGRVVVISDFINTQGIETETAKVALESRGVVVNFLNTIQGSKKKSNVGIIGLDVGEKSTTVFVHNYDETDRKVGISVGDLKKDLTIPAQQTKTFAFETPKKIAQVALHVKDAFALDNVAYVSVPEKKQVDVLLITNNISVFLKNAITSSTEFNLEIAEPPIVPKGDYDVYVVHDITPGNILPGTLDDIRTKVEKGASLIIHAQSNSEMIDYEGLLPVKISGTGGASVINVDQVTSFTKNIAFGGVEGHLLAATKPGVIRVGSVGESVVLAFEQKKQRKIFYYGILEKESGFKLSPSYPIFWVKLIEFLVDQENIENLNHKTGETLILADVATVKTPTTWLKQNVLLFEEIGVYEYLDHKVASSMLDGDESNINAKEIVGEQTRTVELKPVTETREFNLGIPLLVFVLFILLMELIYIKARGDI